MTVFSEASTVQGWLVARLMSLGWSHVPGQDLPRDVTDAICEPWLSDALMRLNPVMAEGPERVDEVLPVIRAAILSAASDGLMAANERLTTILRGEHPIKFVGTEHHVPVRLIDFDDLSNNEFVVSGPLPGSKTPLLDEVTYGPAGAKQRRFDVVLWVNGLPLVVVETKTPVSASVSWLNGARDIANVYERDCPAFFATNVLSGATEGREFHYGAVGQPAESWLMWGSTDDRYDLGGLPRVERSVDLLLTPARVLSILRDFTLFERLLGGGARKLIPRYPQVEAAELIHRRVLDGGRKGLIWHYQGTGKSLLMAFAALMLLNDERVDAPTVLVVLDRLDLVEQVQRQFQTAGLPRLTVAEDKAELRRLLAEDRRGIIVTTIFRFEGAGELNTRDNIIVFVDEAHRTTEGSLGEDMREALPNARFFGLTGTPVADKERNTFRLFGDPGDPGYVLNTYTMERSIADGASVPVHVENRLIDFQLDRDDLDEAEQALADEEYLSEEEREFLAGKAGHVKTILLNTDRIAAVCRDILDHYTTKIAPNGFKAQVVAFDRELVVAYEHELKRLIAERDLPYDTAVVMTVGAKDDPESWLEYNLDRAIEAQIKARFNDPDDPLTFLIVTAKLLTGFDAPIEQVMYLDRPLRRHTLFQAITRTNRRYTNPVTGVEKNYGLIVDYIGLGNQIALALKAADPDRHKQRPVDVDTLAAEFDASLAVCLQRFAGIDRTDGSFAALQAALERIPTQDDRDAFAAEFTAVEALWEFLDPHPTLDAHRDDYRWLAQVYTASRPSKPSNDLLWARLGAKTLAMVHGAMSNVQVTGTGLEEVVVDPEAIEAMRKLVEQGVLDLPDDRDLTNDPVTIDEVLTAIDRRIQQRLNTSGHHIYRTLAEQIENLRRMAVTRAEDSVEFLKKALDIARAALQAEKLETEGKLDAAAETLLDPHIGALTQIVEQYAPPGVPIVISDVVRDIDAIVKQVRFTGWAENQDGDKAVRRELRAVLHKYGLPVTGQPFNSAYAYIRENY